mmetsp:Transcript_8438/g.12211  ORF Transcript_8438/g.12211 Transcript_8438/m.12211 type:complete len:257 (-) Transcript_8438:53-823(-)
MASSGIQESNTMKAVVNEEKETRKLEDYVEGGELENVELEEPEDEEDDEDDEEEDDLIGEIEDQNEEESEDYEDGDELEEDSEDYAGEDDDLEDSEEDEDSEEYDDSDEEDEIERRLDEDVEAELAQITVEQAELDSWYDKQQELKAKNIVSTEQQEESNVIDEDYEEEDYEEEEEEEEDYEEEDYDEYDEAFDDKNDEFVDNRRRNLLQDGTPVMKSLNNGRLAGGRSHATGVEMAAGFVLLVSLLALAIIRRKN